MSEKKPVGVDNQFRRTWDKEDYESKQALREFEAETAEYERLGKYRPSVNPTHQKLKVDREHGVGLEDKIGTQVVNITTELSGQGGFFCQLCNMLVKDSASWLDHLNSLRHQRNLGFSLRPAQSSVEDVRRKLSGPRPVRKRTKLEAVSEIEARMRQSEEEERMAKKRAKKEKTKREEQKKKLTAETEELDPELAAIMGFEGFGSSKK